MKVKVMNVKDFEKRLLTGLNKLNKQDIEKIRNKYNSEGDYGITLDGISYWIASDQTASASFKIEYKVDNKRSNMDIIHDIDPISNKVPERIQHFDFTNQYANTSAKIKNNFNIDPQAA